MSDMAFYWGLSVSGLGDRSPLPVDWSQPNPDCSRVPLAGLRRLWHAKKSSGNETTKTRCLRQRPGISLNRSLQSHFLSFKYYLSPLLYNFPYYKATIKKHIQYKIQKVRYFLFYWVIVSVERHGISIDLILLNLLLSLPSCSEFWNHFCYLVFKKSRIWIRVRLLGDYSLLSTCAMTAKGFMF